MNAASQKWEESDESSSSFIVAFTAYLQTVKEWRDIKCSKDELIG